MIENQKRYDQLVGWMERNGPLTVAVLAFIPNPLFDLAGMIAGVLKMPVVRFLFFAMIGKIPKMLLPPMPGLVSQCALAAQNYSHLRRSAQMEYMQDRSNILIENLNASIDELAEFCKIPTISAQKLNLQEGAEAVGKMLKQRGFDVEIHQTAGAPIVFAERKGKSDKTLLFYNHYDVQPPEPLDLWDSPAFEPEIRDGKLYRPRCQ